MTARTLSLIAVAAASLSMGAAGIANAAPSQSAQLPEIEWIPRW